MVDWKDLFMRALWTFIEAFLVAFPVTELGYDVDGSIWKSALLGAATAGISAVKTLIVSWIRSAKNSGEVVLLDDEDPEDDG